MFQNRMSGEIREARVESMFAGSLLQSSFDQRSRRSLTTLSSFGLQALAMGLLLMLPLIKPGSIPMLHRLSTPISLGQPLQDAPPVHAQAGGSAPATSNMLTARLLQPARIPNTTVVSSDDPAPPQLNSVGSGSPMGDTIGVGVPDGIPFGNGMAQPVLRTPPPAPPHPIRISQMSPGSLLYQPQPVYPPMARSARVEGAVVLAALISRDGTIKNLQVVTGHPLLVRAAVEAVSRWRYRPYILNSEPVEVETQITVNFYLAR